MKIKQTILVIAILASATIGLLVSPTVLAEKCGDTDLKTGQQCCDGVVTNVIKCSDSEKSGIWGILLLVINILTAGIGVAAVGGIIYGSILYASAGSDPAKVKKAKEVILNVIIGLIAYALMYSFLNYIIPGGVFS
jgi:hypothetical protein